ncbi:PAS domain S-box-containing protein [Desulfacinum hydrothermale DSM 13146]|uniref:PAS domain S-box-containing protein n=1 Tax=Desulfacinum hydrothermale DSM 13146 TaxID=1121390 RepID=A0A1W1XFC0_9BACT|nr:sigma 54-interacting transcriptional regulator [Desulfacinum hydrothermale]SMC22527.1 PAS domain S-box-containing protein [Desulfacinum hydrothermale DSM 13146]
MSAYTIPSPESLRQEIRASHERCWQYKVDPRHRCNRQQARLSRDGLERRRQQLQDFLDVATAHIEELYQFVAGAGFAVTIADRDGYILHIIGDQLTLDRLRAGNCCPGFRWTERDVGTSALSLSLARGIPVQINDDEHFCRRGHGYTCSAAPVFDESKQLTGVIALSGEASQVHPHTLGMVITAAKAIENQLRISKTSRQLLLQNNYMTALIQSIDSGVMAIDRRGLITELNRAGKQILNWDHDLVGKPFASLSGLDIDFSKVLRDGMEIRDREIFIRGDGRSIHLMSTIKPIFDSSGQVQGILLVFNEIKRIRKLAYAMAGSQAQFTFDDIIGSSAALNDARKLAMLAAQGNSTVLLLGETGTGKELFAQSIHNHSERRAHPFVAINCGAIPRELLESELFGYAEGAFTGAQKGGRPGKFELASGGTLFLDEIGDMSPDMQVKLLRVLQTAVVHRVGEHQPIAVDVRIIAATHLDLQQEVRRGNFREDLFYRLNVFPITIPPLRTRRDDVVQLARHILRRCCSVLGKPGIRFSAAAETALLHYPWPGNVRELENIIERAVNLVDGPVIDAGLLKAIVQPPRRAITLPDGGSLLSDVERQTIAQTLEQNEYNVARSARLLGITRATLYAKVRKYGLSLARGGP